MDLGFHKPADVETSRFTPLVRFERGNINEFLPDLKSAMRYGIMLNAVA
jgi:hypothetical protein